MLLTSITFSARDWLWPAAAALLLGIIAVFWSYRVAGTRTRLAALCALLKLLGLAALALCLLEPHWSGRRARPGANLFAIVADNSQGLQIKDQGQTRTRAEELAGLLDVRQSAWQAALEGNFEVRRFFFDTRLQATRDFHELNFDGRASALHSALQNLRQRLEGRPVAGVLLLTDGNATDLRSGAADLAGLPPVYPVVIGRRSAVRDAAIAGVNVSQSAFEDAPVTVQAEVAAIGLAGESLVVALLDAAGKKLQETTLRVRQDTETLGCRFQFRPEKPGVSFYSLRASLKGEASAPPATAAAPAGAPGSGANSPPAASTREATLLNNQRVLAIDRGKGPHRILYVSGRPNWEYKFLNRAVESDPEVQLVGLIRVATREPKFDFRGRGGETSNPLFRGFGNQSREDTERYDQPVLVRLNTRGASELRAGFPATPEELFSYKAVILDDIEAAFFTADQQALLQRFVSERGGGLLMLGGMETFQQGNYARTPVGDMLPLYLGRGEESVPAGPFRFNLTREGLLQPWARLRERENEEKERLQTMPPFQVLNPAASWKPGATVLATVTDPRGKEYPALLTQRFGRGRTAAFAVGDFWRWGMQNPAARGDMEKAWRQLMRWMVADVPLPVELTVEPAPGDSAEAVTLLIRARDEEFQPMEDASVTIEVIPEGSTHSLVHSSPTNRANPPLATNTSASASASASGAAPATNAPAPAAGLVIRAEPSTKEPGLYEASYVARGTGGYLARAAVTNATGARVGQAEAGWAIDLAAEEFRSLQPNVELLQDWARRTGGELVPAEKLASFARQLPGKTAPVMEPWSTPLWHTPAVFGLALACFVAEWGLRRWKGMP